MISLVRRFSPSTILPQRAWGSLWNMADSGTRSPDVSGKQFWAPNKLLVRLIRGLEAPGRFRPRSQAIAQKSIQPKPIFIVSGWSGRSMRTYPSALRHDRRQQVRHRGAFGTHPGDGRRALRERGPHRLPAAQGGRRRGLAQVNGDTAGVARGRTLHRHHLRSRCRGLPT